ncbi:MAG: DNA repair protein RecO [Bacteroidales bacterium]|nr:DNA repair protein RecO [Bacteroidales bacterium]
MLLNTTGIVLHTTRYGETSVIARIFTRKLGVRPYIVKGVRSPKGRSKQNLLQPLSYLDMVVYDKPRNEINFIKEMQPARQWQTLDTHMAKTTLRFFASEALSKSLHEAEPMPELFDYVVDTMQRLDEERHFIGGYPLTFMLGLTRHLGIEPLDNYSLQEPCFNLSEGCFQSPSRFQPQLSPQQSFLLHHYLEASRTGSPSPVVPLSDRQALLNSVISYYQVHLSDFKNFKSHEVLHGVLQ